MHAIDPDASAEHSPTTQMRVTKAQEIQESLADDIVRGRIKPGEPLDEARLAAAFGASRTPVREAIRQLEAIGLAEARPHRGAVAVDIPEERLDQMFVVMAELEALCARLAAVSMTARERRAFDELHRSTGAIVSSGDLDAYVAANDVFHETLYAGAHNGFLEETTLSVRARLAPFRHAQFDTIGRIEKSHAEHGRVAEAVIRGDGEAAAEEMRRHILVVRTAVEQVTHPHSRELIAQPRSAP